MENRRSFPNRVSENNYRNDEDINNSSRIEEVSERRKNVNDKKTQTVIMIHKDVQLENLPGVSIIKAPILSKKSPNDPEISYEETHLLVEESDRDTNKHRLFCEDRYFLHEFIGPANPVDNERPSQDKETLNEREPSSEKYVCPFHTPRPSANNETHTPFFVSPLDQTESRNNTKHRNDFSRTSNVEFHRSSKSKPAHKAKSPNYPANIEDQNEITDALPSQIYTHPTHSLGHSSVTNSSYHKSSDFNNVKADDKLPDISSKSPRNSAIDSSTVQESSNRNILCNNEYCSLDGSKVLESQNKEEKAKKKNHPSEKQLETVSNQTNILDYFDFEEYIAKSNAKISSPKQNSPTKHICDCNKSTFPNVYPYKRHRTPSMIDLKHECSCKNRESYQSKNSGSNTPKSSIKSGSKHKSPSMTDTQQKCQEGCAEKQKQTVSSCISCKSKQNKKLSPTDSVQDSQQNFTASNSKQSSINPICLKEVPKVPIKTKTVPTKGLLNNPQIIQQPSPHDGKQKETSVVPHQNNNSLCPNVFCDKKLCKCSNSANKETILDPSKEMLYGYPIQTSSSYSRLFAPPPAPPSSKDTVTNSPEICNMSKVSLKKEENQLRDETIPLSHTSKSSTMSPDLACRCSISKLTIGKESGTPRCCEKCKCSDYNLLEVPDKEIVLNKTIDDAPENLEISQNPTKTFHSRTSFPSRSHLSEDVISTSNDHKDPRLSNTPFSNKQPESLSTLTTSPRSSSKSPEPTSSPIISSFISSKLGEPTSAPITAPVSSVKLPEPPSTSIRSSIAYPKSPATSGSLIRSAEPISPPIIFSKSSIKLTEPISIPITPIPSSIATSRSPPQLIEPTSTSNTVPGSSSKLPPPKFTPIASTRSLNKSTELTPTPIASPEYSRKLVEPTSSPITFPGSSKKSTSISSPIHPSSSKSKPTPRPSNVGNVIAKSPKQEPVNTHNIESKSPIPSCGEKCCPCPNIKNGLMSPNQMHTPIEIPVDQEDSFSRPGFRSLSVQTDTPYPIVVPRKVSTSVKKITSTKKKS